MEMPERPQIIYALVVRHGEQLVLVDYADTLGNFQDITVTQILPKLNLSLDFKSYVWDQYAFHYMTHKELGVVYLCMADATMGRRKPFTFLNAVKDSFSQRYSHGDVMSSASYGMHSEFRPELQQLVAHHNAPDRVDRLRGNLRDLNDSLAESIDKVLLRGQNIELLVERSQHLSDASTSFVRQAHVLRRNMRWKNIRMIVVLVCLAVLVVAIVVFSSCGISFKRC